MLFYSRDSWQRNLAQFVMFLNSDCMCTGDLLLQLWLKNCCKNTGYYSIFLLSLLFLLNNYQYKCNNTISSVSVEGWCFVSSKFSTHIYTSNDPFYRYTINKKIMYASNHTIICNITYHAWKTEHYQIWADALGV